MPDNPSSENLNLVHLMAYVIQADGKVSDQEIDFFSKYIKAYYPKNEAENIFQGFLQALQDRPILESILDNVNKDYGEDYMGKINLLIRIYELLGADGITPSELDIFDNVCGFFAIDEEDADLIKSLLIDLYDFDFMSNINRKIIIGEDPQSVDLVYDNSNCEIFEIHGHFYLVNKHKQASIFIDEELVHTAQIITLQNKKIITLNKKDILINDIDLFFRLKKTNYSKQIYLAYENQKMVKKIDFSKADFRLEITQNIIRLYKNRMRECSIKVNQKEIDDFSFVNVSDSVVLENSFSIPLREILATESRDVYSLKEFIPEKDILIISDQDQLADIYIDDGHEKELYISIQLKKREQGINFTLEAIKLPYEIYINNNIVKQGEKKEIQEDSKLIIGKNHVLFHTDTGKIVTSIIHFSRFTVDHLTYKFKSGRVGIDDISFEAKSGELIGIMGASGAGKSTLLQLLLGYYKPYSGQVRVNGEDFYEHFDKVRNYIGYVPQDDLLFENLTVYQNLYYAAKIRMPGRSRKEIDFLIESVLKDIGLLDKKDLKVGNPVQKVLSGGQRKRLNIGLELLADPDLFFLDEPTSGLSSKDSEMIINLLSHLSKKGKIIFVIIHQPGSDIYKKFDKLLLLDVGGKLAYYGDSLKAIQYFKNFFPIRDDFIECPSCGNVNPEIIFNVLEKKELGKDGLPLYTKKEHWGKGIGKFFRKLFRNPKKILLPTRRYDPDYWKQLYLSKQTTAEKPEQQTTIVEELPPMKKKSLVTKLKILVCLFRRNFVEKLNDGTNMIMTFLVPFILGLILSLLLKGGNTPYMFFSNTQFTKYLFLSTIIFIFFGLMSSVNEVIKDRPILIREKIVDIKPWQYLLSKSITFSIFALLQVIIFVSLGFFILKIPVFLPTELNHLPIGNFYLYFILMGFVTTYASFSLGLLISSLLRSELAAFNIIPLIIIPQIIFGGMFVQFTDMAKIMNKEVPIYSDITFARWSYEGLLAGSEYFNPMYQVTNTSHIIKIKEKYEKERGEWDSEEVLYTPIAGLKFQVIEPVPKKISAKEFEDRIEAELEKNYPELKDKIKKYYIENDSQEYYLLNNEITNEDIDEIKDIFKKAGPNGYYTKYLVFEINEAVHKDFYDARTLEWMKKLKGRDKAGIRDWLTDINIFPAHDKIWGRFVYKTIWYNLIVLLLHACLFHVLTLWKLKKL